ncbi:MAG: hypothetical protein HKO65_02450 [Gemmatimonadetes bacterium]|nr:hypothetical protein [Gemmatimonadota bacterium]
MKTELQSILANKSDRLIVTAINEGFLEMTLNWLESLRRVGLGPENVLIFSLDPASARSLKKNGLETILFEDSEYEETPRGVIEYRESDAWDWIINKRLEIQVMLLRAGRSFLACDTDIVFLKNPFDYIEKTAEDTGCDLLFQCDYGEEGRDYEQSVHRVCCGFFWVKPTEKTKDLLSFSREEYDRTGWDDQKMVNTRLGTWLDSDAERTRLRSEFNVRLLPQDLFPNGSHWRLHGPEIEDRCYMVHYNFMYYREKIPIMQKSGHWFLDTLPRTVESVRGTAGDPGP